MNLSCVEDRVVYGGLTFANVLLAFLLQKHFPLKLETVSVMAGYAKTVEKVHHKTL